MPKDQTDNFLNWGYWSAPLVNKAGQKIGIPETKVLVLNSNICYQFNWESIINF